MIKTIYLVRHSIKENNYGIIDNNDSLQLLDEKKVLTYQGEELAIKLSKLKEFNDIDQIWSSNYVRAIQTAKFIAYNNNLKLNISSSFDERHYGDLTNVDLPSFWANQFIDENLKNKNGESQIEVRNRMNNKINELLSNNYSKIVIVAHNACILFYLLKYCTLIKAEVPKKITIKYKNKYLIKESIMSSPSYFKLNFEDNKLLNITYFKI